MSVRLVNCPNLITTIHRKKKVREFPVPSRDVTTKLSLGGNNDVITELFLPRGSLVSDIPAGDGKLVNLYLRCSSHRVFPEPVFVNLLWSPGVDSQPDGTVQQPYLSYRPARLHCLVESIPRNRFLGSINVYKYGLWAH